MTQHLKTYNVGMIRARIQELKEKKLDDKDKHQDMECTASVSIFKLQRQRQCIMNVSDDLRTQEEELPKISNITGAGSNESNGTPDAGDGGSTPE